jgi:hypothetical protein
MLSLGACDRINMTPATSKATQLTHPFKGFDHPTPTHVHQPTFANMSYPSFGETGAQPQQPAQEHGGFTGGPDQQQNPMGQQMDQQQMNQQMGQQQMGQQQMGQQQMGQQMGQQMDQTQPQGQFQGPPTSGTPGAQGGQSQEGKTTLWYVYLERPKCMQC